jgi:hypothetical protein
LVVSPDLIRNALRSPPTTAGGVVGVAVLVGVDVAVLVDVGVLVGVAVTVGTGIAHGDQRSAACTVNMRPPKNAIMTPTANR